jgi:tetratricopeptide (TPR) repeat protein
MGRLSRLPLILVKCGEIHLLAGERDQSIELAESALRLAMQQNERANEAYARHLLAEIHSPGEAAERFYREALESATELGMAPLAARCHAGLAMIYMTMSRNDAAEGHRTHARQMFKSMEMRFWLARLDAATTDAAR